MTLLRIEIALLTLTVWSFVAGATGNGTYADDSSFYAGGLLLRRSNQNNSVLANVVADPTRRITSDALDHDFGGGFELSLTKAICGDTSRQIRYFGWFESPAEGSLATVAPENIQLNTTVPINATAGTSIDVSADSTLHSLEANRLVGLTENTRLIFGLRYLNLSEELSIATPGSAAETEIDIDTHNNLFGGQLGLDAHLLTHERFALDFFGRSGLMWNHAEQDSTSSTIAVSLNSSERDDVVAFVGELNLRGSYQLSSATRVSLGYQALWLANVALADDQLGSTNFITASGLADSGDVLFHGFNIGLSVSY